MHFSEPTMHGRYNQTENRLSSRYNKLTVEKLVLQSTYHE